MLSKQELLPPPTHFVASIVVNLVDFLKSEVKRSDKAQDKAYDKGNKQTALLILGLDKPTFSLAPFFVGEYGLNR